MRISIITYPITVPDYRHKRNLVAAKKGHDKNSLNKENGWDTLLVIRTNKAERFKYQDREHIKKPALRIEQAYFPINL